VRSREWGPKGDATDLCPSETPGDVRLRGGAALTATCPLRSRSVVLCGFQSESLAASRTCEILAAFKANVPSLPLFWL